jgi:hypothetical protein
VFLAQRRMSRGSSRESCWFRNLRWGLVKEIWGMESVDEDPEAYPDSESRDMEMAESVILSSAVPPMAAIVR